jgi:CubicO group peptidase (beta-lactamase class C family)
MDLLLKPGPALALFALVGCCWAVQAATAEPDLAATEAAIRAFVAREEIPAAHVTLLRGDTVLLQRAYGSVGDCGPAPNAGSIFPLGSISKQFTAAAILSLADARKLRLDDPVGKYLPEWFAGEPGLKVSHLLWQTSGLADFLWLEGYRPLGDDASTPMAAYVALGAAAPRRFAPGTRWAYSNTNYKALALIAERVTGESFDSVLAKRVLRPLGLDGIVPCHDLAPEQLVPGVSAAGKPAPLDRSRAAYAGDGGLCGTAADLQRWIRVGLAPRDGLGARLAGPAVLADGTRVPYGFGLSTREFLGRAIVWHGGNVDSHTSEIAYLPGQDLGLVILTSRGYVWLTELMPALLGMPPPARGGPAGGRLAGRFEDGLFRYAVRPEGENMRVEIDLIGMFLFVPAGPREYVAEQLPATLRIRLPADGSLDRFEFGWIDLRSYAFRERE